MYSIKESRELLVCQHATNLLPSHSALPNFKQSAHDVKSSLGKNILAQWAEVFGVGLKKLPSHCLILPALITPPPHAH